MNSLNSVFLPDERLYRAVRPDSIFWKEDGSLTSAAFKDKNGLSVQRGDYRADKEVVEEMMRIGFEGRIVRVDVSDCNDANAIVVYVPMDDNEYHSEIHSSNDKILLTSGQARQLARSAVVID